MKTYVIRLDTVQNLKDYLYMLETVSFSGIAKSGHNFMKPEDVPFAGFSNNPLLLMIESGDDDALKEIEAVGRSLRIFR